MGIGEAPRGTVDGGWVRKQFRSDIDAIAEKLIAIFGLKYSKAKPRLSQPVARWMDFRLRSVDPTPRHVLYSDRFQRSLPIHVRGAVHAMELKFRAGENVNPYQSRGLTSHNDYSGKQPKRRTDLLWSDWGISHFHLTEKPPLPGDFFVPRSGYHLLAIVEPNVVLFIDAVPHLQGEQYADVALLGTVQRCWPTYMERYEVRGCIVDGDELSTGDRLNLRQNGVNSFVQIDGKLYMGPGMGVTTAVTALNVTLQADRVMDAVDDLATWVSDPDGPFLGHAAVADLAEPEFSLGVFGNALAVYEARSKHAFCLPRHADADDRDLHKLFLPAWAGDAVAAHAPLLPGVAEAK